MRIRVAIAALCFAGAGGIAVAQTASPQTQTQPPASMSGRVVEVDQKSGRLVIQTSNGQRREFRMSPGELANTKVGDEVEATRVNQPAPPLPSP
jgi:hypothetical protein